MRIQETLFVTGHAVGQLLMETDTQAISFHPANGQHTSLTDIEEALVEFRLKLEKLHTTEMVG